MQISETLSSNFLSLKLPQNTPKNCKLISKIGDTWLQIANERKLLTDDPEKIQIFSNAIAISQYFSQYEKISQGTDNIIFCIDDTTQKVQAIALYSIQKVFESSGKNFGNCFKISEILTNPKNIKLSDAQNSANPEMVRGAASAIIKFLANKCLENNLNGIYVESVNSARSFYKKLAFQELTRGAYSIEEQLYPMLRLVASKDVT